MAGPRSIFRYILVRRDGSATLRCRVEADADATGLRLNGVTNIEPTAVNASLNLNMEIPVLPGRRGNKARARVVQIRYTEGSAVIDLGSTAWVPVFRVDSWDSYEVGQTGTHRGVACVLVRKVDGSPTRTGKRNL